MAIKIEKSFTVDAPPSAVWEFLTDPARVASCLPGTSISEKVDDRTYKGTTSVKVGPISASYKGKMTFERLDEAAGEAEMKASAQDVSGRGGADMRMSSKLIANDAGGTDVTVVSEVIVMGLLAQLGRGMIQDVSDVLFEQFTEAMAKELEQSSAKNEVAVEPAAEPVTQEPATTDPPEPEARAAQPPAVETAPDAGSEPDPDPAPEFDAADFSAKVARRTLVRKFTSPTFWIGIAVVAALVWWLLR